MEIVKAPFLKNKYENYDLLFSYVFNNDNDLVVEYEIFLRSMDKVEVEYEKFKKLGEFKKELLLSDMTQYYSISDIDHMNGILFEKFLKQLFVNMGFQFRVTKSTQDQGLDLIVEKDSELIGVQAKCYSSSHIGNKAIQEVIAGTKFYKCSKGIVVTNSYFTKQAIDLAKRTNVILWDKDKLISLLIEFPVIK